VRSLRLWFFLGEFALAIANRSERCCQLLSVRSLLLLLLLLLLRPSHIERFPFLLLVYSSERSV